MPSRRGLAILFRKSYYFQRIFILSTMLGSTRTMLVPTRKMLPALTLGKRLGCTSSSPGHSSYHRRFVNPTDRTIFTPSSLTSSGIKFSTSKFENLSVKNGYLEEFERLEMDDEDLGIEEVPATDLPKGSNDGFYIVKTYKTESGGFDMSHIRTLVTGDDVERLELTSQNISVPVALMMVDGDEYPSQSRARKACRNANIMIHRGPLAFDNKTGKEIFDSAQCFRARVGDRVFPGDVLGKQVRMGEGYFPVMSHKKPPFDLPVVYEDDHLAICNKPSGVVVYAQRGGGHGLMTLRAALPFAVSPPKAGTISILRRPQPVHRLDKPTSGLILVAKTKPAMVHLSSQFRDRKVKKTYVAIVNGIPLEPWETRTTSQMAHAMGVDVDPDEMIYWQYIDQNLDEKHAVTIWRTIKYAKSLKAADGYVALVELKPKTGRYHQLRRHMAWVCKCPIIGDTEYDGGGAAMQLRGNGLFLCSNRVTLEHPYYNTPVGRREFEEMTKEERRKNDAVWLADDGTVMVGVSIPIPDKFESFLKREEERYNRLSQE